MAKSPIIKSVCAISLILIVSSLGFSQSNDYRKLSLTVSGGVSLGDLNKGNYFMSSNFSVNTEDTPTYGMGIQYALTPIWSFELGYRHNQIIGVKRNFEAQINQFSLKSIINLNQLFSLNRVTPRLNPFITAGAGYDFYSYDGSDDQFTSHNTSYDAGIGIAFQLTSSVDLISQYEYHMSSNSIDNINKGFGADLINSVTAGVRINFGKKNSELASWREPPVDLSRSDYNNMMMQARLVYDLRERLEQVEQRDRALESLTVQLYQQSTQLDSLVTRLNQMNNRIHNLRLALSQHQVATNTVDINHETGFTESLARGFYVQIFAATNLRYAQDMRTRTIDRVGDVLTHADEKVFIIRRKKYYEVFVGMFSDFSHARQVQQVMQQLRDDAYVISFPRPRNLKEDFAGLNIIDETGTEVYMSQQ